MRLSFERTLPVDAARAWPHLAEPRLMNRWSRAAIESVAPGDGGHPAGIGALRVVRLPGGRTLEEVIEDSAPPGRLVYRVFRGAPVRSHRGTIALEGDTLRWTVELEGALPGVEALAARLLRRDLAASLDLLVRRVADAVTPLPFPPDRALDESAELPVLTAAARACADEQAALAARLLERGDDRGWFARVYHHVSELMIAGAGALRHPGWGLALIPPFHRMYASNLRARLTGGVVEPHWRRAFAATERLRARGVPRFDAAVRAIYVGMRAHIEHDLPRALAEVHRARYAGRCDIARFRADYLRMAAAIPTAGDRLLAELPRRAWPWRARVLDHLTPAHRRPHLLERTVYPLGPRRREAFDRAAALLVD